MRTVLLTLAAVAALGAAAGGSVIAFGLYNVSAKAGHWPITAWVLHTTYRNAVELRAPAEDAVPELTEAMMSLGIRHFDAACRECHAAPGEERVATMRAMLPEPPHITEAVEGWEPRHLGWIVREGVKMSGMPAWPASREDEMWSVVAFLARVRGMDEATYLDLTAPAPAPAEAPEGLAYCAGCHGLDGNSANPHVPRLDILDEGYVAMSLQAYLDGTRESGIMSHAATEVPAEALPALAAYFAAQVPGEAARPADPGLAARGRDLAFAATDDPEVPACVACHGPRAGEVPTLPTIGPALAGQHEAYLTTQLRLWRAGHRGGGPRAELMRQAAEHLTDHDIAALAAYFASLAPAPDRD